MKIRDIVAPLEEFAPLYYQESYDNSGLVVGRYDDEVRSALLCVDVTDQVLNEAEQTGAKLVISHHPIIFHAMKRFNGKGYVERIVERAIRAGIALYACHTNLDSAPGGMSYRLADILGVQNLQLLVQNGDADSLHGFGVTGHLPTPAEPLAFLRDLQEKLGVKVVRYSDIILDKIQKISICSGSGASLIEAAKNAGADLYIAADFKYNDFMAAEGVMIVADIGHFESEFCAIDLMYEIISKKIATFALHKSKSSRNPVNYLV